MAYCFTNVTAMVPDAPQPPTWLLVDEHVPGIPWVLDYGVGQPPTGAHIRVIDGAGGWLLPGFVDVHVHGAVGHDVMDADPDGLRAMAHFFARHGVTRWLATTWTDTRERIYAACLAVQRAMRAQSSSAPVGALLAGVHLEGPYLNPAYAGAQRADLVRPVDRDELTELLNLAVLQLVSFAPEVNRDQWAWLTNVLAQERVCGAVAHSGASFDVAAAALEAGLIGHVTHTFNAMTPFHHREPGIIGALTRFVPQANRAAAWGGAELIADNIHVHPAAMAVLLRLVERVILVTDAVRPTGLPDGPYDLDGRAVVVQDGACRLPDGTLAGSVLTMDAALRNLMLATGLPLAKAWRYASAHAAAFVGEEYQGVIELSGTPDLVLLDRDYQVSLTMVNGTVVYDREERYAPAT